MCRKMLVIGFVFVFAIVAQATMTTSDGNWHSSAIWDGGVPTSATDAMVVNQVEISSAANANNTNVGWWDTGSGQLTVAAGGGSLHLTDSVYVGVQRESSMYMNGYLHAPGCLSIGYYGNGTVYHTGTADVGALYIGHVNGNGTMYLQSGSIKVWTAFGMDLSNAPAWLDITGGAIVLPGEVTDITTYGNVTAYGGTGSFVYDATSDPGYTIVTAVPEPATIALLGIGLLALRRR